MKGGKLVYWIRKYPWSILVGTVILYLSFFKPPSSGVRLFEGMDKVAHVAMYGGLSGMLWIEFFRNHRRRMVKWHGWTGAVVCPLLFGGLVEVGQAYLTSYRGGDWLDFGADALGVGLATWLAWTIVRPWIEKRYGKGNGNGMKPAGTSGEIEAEPAGEAGLKIETETKGETENRMPEREMKA